MPANDVEVTVTYTKNSYSYTVEHYWIGDKDKLDAQPFHTDADENQTALFDSAVAYQENGASWVIRTNPVYTFAKADPEKITITSDPSKNVLKLYYYKNVKLTANSDTLPYNGKEQHVFGYTCAVAEMKDGRVEYVPWTGEKPLTFEGVSASGLGKDVNKDGYRVEFNETPIGETDGLYYVNESQTGTLTITPAPVTLQAPIQSKTYDGTPLEATQFGHSYLEGLDFADDFESIILTGSQTLVGSSASLITGVIPNEGKKLTNYNFTFVPGTLTVTDGTGDDPVKPENVVTKTHIPKDMGYNRGDKVTFTISVTNIYNEQKEVTLEEQPGVTFVDPQGAAIGTKATKTLEPGEKWEIQATYTITSNDILAGVFRNTLTATFGHDKSWEARDEEETAELDTTLYGTKTSDVPDGQKAALGQTITYTIKVQNAGNVPYTNVKVEDPLTKLTATIETLAVGETKTFTTEYVVTEADVLEGHVLNTATATGDEIKDPKSDEPKEPNGGDEVETPTFSPITIKPKDVTATYNGAAITGKDVEITSGKLLEGHKLSAAVIGSGVNAGSYELTLDPEKIKIVDANNKDVSEMYARTILPGKLIINKRSVLITSQSATKTYDGSALTHPAVTITGDGFVPGELAKAEATGSITKVGSTPNTIRYTTTGAFNAANYSIDLLLSGEVDLLNKMVAADTISKGIQSTADQPFSVANYPRSGLSMISFSCERQTVSSKAVRQAIASCFDRDALVKAYTGNFGLKANGYFGIGQWMYQLAAGTIQPPVADLPANATAKEIAAYEKTVAQWDALSLDKLKDYPLDLDQAAKLLDQDEWRLGKDGIRAKKIDGKTVALDLTLIYPEGNAVGDTLNATLAENLAAIGVRLTVKAVPMNELLDIYYRRVARDCDMIYLATNFGTVFDPSTTYSTDEAYVKTVNRTGIRDKKLAQLAVDMRKTEPGDVLSYCRKWVAFQERWTEVLPAIPVYSNVYFDFYTTRLQNYRVTENQTWTQAIVGATLTQTAE